MMQTTLTWFPPAPGEGPLSILTLPPDDWILQAKPNGIRVIVEQGHIWTRHGKPLSPEKDVANLADIIRPLPSDLAFDGEWLPQQQRLFLFDIAAEVATLDSRLAGLAEILRSARSQRLCLIPMAKKRFADFYVRMRRKGMEGVVIKRRNSLYHKQPHPGMKTNDWLKRRFEWDA